MEIATMSRRALQYAVMGLLISIVVVLVGCGPQAESGGSGSQTPSGAQSESGSSGVQLASNEVVITKQEFGADWPFTVDEGVLAGIGSDGFGEVTFTANGTTYAVNGTAKGTGKYSEVDEIWADDPSISGTKINIGPVIDRGLELCR